MAILCVYVLPKQEYPPVLPPGVGGGAVALHALQTAAAGIPPDGTQRLTEDHQGETAPLLAHVAQPLPDAAQGVVPNGGAEPTQDQEEHEEQDGQPRAVNILSTVWNKYICMCFIRFIRFLTTPHNQLGRLFALSRTQ